ncbi:carbohydrate ABC transporter permease [Paenibacillus algorifonticola]|uniref:carbohydrate ABC transporter permease n=1 Tax=Paenibacillus algorifonticola TaxID=684063 RepID=UPI003D272E16
MKGRDYSFRLFSLEAFTILLGLMFLVPFYFLVTNSFKTFAELLTDTASFPTSFNLDNYVRAWDTIQFPRALTNSLIITVASVAIMILISAMAAYRMARRPSKFNQAMFSLFVVAMVIPFQTIMIPLVKVGKWLHFLNTYSGIVLCYVGLGLSFSIFLYHGFIKSIPLEIEESATIDGCNPYGVFWRIIFPLLKPMTVTVMVLQSLWVWNDFLLPMLVLQDKSMQTIQLATNALFGQYMKQWDLALAALVMGILPILAFFLFMQRHIIEGITAGAVKG